MNAEDLYRTITNNLNGDYLKDLSVQIIDAYRSKNYRVLSAYGRHIMPELTQDKTPPNRLFFMLIKHFHPDRLEAIRRAVDEAYRSGDEKTLGFYANVSRARTEVRPQRRVEHEKRDETYGYGAEDFGFDFDPGYRQPEEDVDPEDIFDEREEEFDFLSALKAEHLGNLDMEITPADLAYLEGELVLAGYELQELDGLEYCVNITSLDLSDNEITNIYEVQALVHLREIFLANNHVSDLSPLGELAELEILDVSFNDVDDLSPLLSLGNLKFVNLQGNPLEETETIHRLEERSVVVIY
jgi:hypothetical protein